MEMRCDALEGKTIRWSKDSAVLQTKTAGYGTSLHISLAQQSDEGTYTCDVMNNAGEIQASYDVTLRVEGQYFESSILLPERTKNDVIKFSRMNNQHLILFSLSKHFMRKRI